MPLIYRLPGRRASEVYDLEVPDLDADLDTTRRVDGIHRGRQQYFFRCQDFYWASRTPGWNMATPGKHTRPLWVLLTARDGTWTSYRSSLAAEFMPNEFGTWHWFIWRPPTRGHSSPVPILEGTAADLKTAHFEVLHLADNGAIAPAEKRKKREKLARAAYQNEMRPFVLSLRKRVAQIHQLLADGANINTELTLLQAEVEAAQTTEQAARLPGTEGS